jgi:hypothetical protein
MDSPSSLNYELVRVERKENELNLHQSFEEKRCWGKQAATSGRYRRKPRMYFPLF